MPADVVFKAFVMERTAGPPGGRAGHSAGVLGLGKHQNHGAESLGGLLEHSLLGPVPRVFNLDRRSLDPSLSIRRLAEFPGASAGGQERAPRDPLVSPIPFGCNLTASRMHLTFSPSCSDLLPHHAAFDLLPQLLGLLETFKQILDIMSFHAYRGFLIQCLLKRRGLTTLRGLGKSLCMLLGSSASLWSFHPVAKLRASLCKSDACVLVLRPPKGDPHQQRACQVPRCCWIFQQANLVWGPHLSASGHEPQSVITYSFDHNLP